MAIDNINNNSNSTLLNDIYNSKTNSSDKTSSTNNTAKATNTDGKSTSASNSDIYSLGILSNFNLQNSGYLNYGAKGTYINPSLADYLDSGKNNLFGSSSQDGSDGSNLTNYLNNNDEASSDEQETQLESAFSGLADQMEVKNIQLIKSAIAKLSAKNNK